MSAIVSLLRVMTYRDAEAITLEVGKVPALRRKGQIEALAMPALEARMLEEFVMPLVDGKQLEQGPVMVAFTDADGTTYPVTIERGPGGLRAVVKKPAPPKKAPPAAPPPPVAKPAPAPAPAAQATQEHASPALVIENAVTASSDAREKLVALLSAPISIAKDRGASDLFLSTISVPRVKIDGRLETLDVHVDDHEIREVAGALVHQDLSLQLPAARVRVNVFDHQDGYAIAARLIKEHVPTLHDLALPPELANIVELRDGLVLVCGPTGSGKSTTLAALIDMLDQKRSAHVITLEDPIEYRFQPRRCLIHQRELGTHIPTFASGLRAALREAPDVILLGELRDRETLSAALTAAETGHLVLATLHAPNAIGAIDRVIDAFPDTQQRQIRTQLSACLRTIVTQFLLPRRDGGRAVAVEVVPVTTAVANIIRKGDLHTLPTAIQAGREAGMIPLERSLAKLIDSGQVAPKAVQRIAADHDLLQALAGKLR
jgi:twitching motility protein PilT